MMRLAALGAGLVTLAILAGCATLSRAECEAGDWRALGASDGTQGRPLSYVDQHVSACSEHGVRVDRALYESGRNDGLRAYCRLERAEREGRAGRTYYSVCTGEMGVSFNRVYLDAKAISDFDRQVTSTRRELDSLIDRLTAPGLSESEINRLRLDIRRMQNQIDRLERQRAAAERELAATRRLEDARLAALGITA